MKKYILVIDQGTTSSRLLLVNKNAKIVYKDYIKINLNKKENGLITQDANEILKSVKMLIERVFENFNVNEKEIDSIAITNQRETTIIWDKRTNKVIDQAISWQSNHTKNITNDWINKGYKDKVFEKTGLLINPYFSASKIKYLIDKHNLSQENIMFGTIDSFLIYNLTKEKNHFTDITNASRTMLYNIKENKWDLELLKLFNINKNILPKVLENDSLYGHVLINKTLIPIRSVIGDQQSALFGHLCTKEGETKVTYGTGSFILTNLGEKLVYSNKGLLTTISYKLENSKVNYALEGSVFMGGEAIKWMKEKLSLFKTASETENYAYKSKDNSVYVVPAFVGLGAPHWDSNVRASILGLKASTKKEDIIKATLNSISYQVTDILKVIEKESNLKIESIKVDGGVSKNNYLMKYQANLINATIIQNKESEITGLGASFISGLKTNFFKSIDSLKKLVKINKIFMPDDNLKQTNKEYEKWLKALHVTKQF